ncbi:cupin domain-containing protein [Sphingomonas sp.]|uniref:CDGSH iron-sulfur domain-containing protein n=1 Tax=Sphingomonas sp. TaxID=28214 RepID=UPI0025DA8E93|nr:cupin domain-containing protein [Sphingomonas sp.]
MDEPAVAATKPCLVALVEGRRYSWCSCGLSKNQPFCDNSHVGTGFKPILFKAQETDEELLCACKRTKSPPYCDGSHNSLTASYGAPMDEIASDAAMVEPSDLGNGASRAALDANCFVITPRGAAEIYAGGLALYQVIGPRDGARRLSQFAGSLAQGAGPIVRFADADAVIYVISGSGTIEIGSRHFALPAESGAYVRKGEAFRIHADDAIALNITVCPLGPLPETLDTMPQIFDDAVEKRVEPVDASERSAMADRYYQVLVDGEKQGTEVTQFIGHIPFSRAAHHRHLYEETLTVLSGQGVMWTDTTKTVIRPGDTIFLPRKQSHSVECTSAEGMMIVGVFYPTMSPAINY